MEIKFMNKEVMIQRIRDRIQCCKIYSENLKQGKETYETETVNKTERTRNHSIIKPERIANTERQMYWFNMVSSSISTEMHTTGREKKKERKEKKKKKKISLRDTQKVSKKIRACPARGANDQKFNTLASAHSK